MQTILEHLGSAHDDAQLAALVAIARQRIAEMNGQEQLDLESLVPASRPRSTGPTVVGSRSRVLWEVLEAAYARLGFDTVGNDTFRKLVLARVVEPASKADTLRVWDELGVPDAPSLSTVWRTLARSVKEDWRSRFAAAAYAHATRNGPLTVVLYDCTTLYFEAEREDKLRRVGMSKERRVDPQILVGLLVDQGGFPLEVHEFAGNKGETLTLLPVLDQFRERHRATEIVVVADAGMLSAANLNKLEDGGFSFIVGSRTSSAPYDLAEHYATVGNIVIGGETVETTRVMGAGANARRRRVVWQYSHKRKTRDNITLNKQIERAEQIAAGTRPPKKDRFVTLGHKPAVIWARIEKAREHLGLKGYVTNLPSTTATADEVVAAYHDLFQVEASFRMAKTDLRARPMFASTEDSIHAHLTVVFAALAISRHLHAATAVSTRRIVRALRPLRDVTISINGHELTAPTPPAGEAAEILTTLYPRTLRTNVTRSRSKAEVAEVPFTAFRSRKKAEQITGRLVVRRIPDLNPKQLEQPTLFDTYRHHAFFTTTSKNDMGTVVADKTHRGHAIIEQVHADLKNGPLAHLPSGVFTANSAWLVLAVIAFNLTRTAGLIADRAGRLARATTATIRRTLIYVPARLARSARRVTLHLPEAWPWQAAFDRLFAATHAPPPTATT